MQFNDKCELGIFSLPEIIIKDLKVRFKITFETQILLGKTFLKIS